MYVGRPQECSGPAALASPCRPEIRRRFEPTHSVQFGTDSTITPSLKNEGNLKEPRGARGSMPDAPKRVSKLILDSYLSKVAASRVSSGAKSRVLHLAEAARGPFWVNHYRNGMSDIVPVHPRTRTLPRALGTSQKCHGTNPLTRDGLAARSGGTSSAVTILTSTGDGRSLRLEDRGVHKLQPQDRSPQ
jgi:hypothetical protein